jgi:hypothetical protein
VVDQSTPPNPVIGAIVAFQTTVLRPGGASNVQETGSSNPATPVILSVNQSSEMSDANGLASILPSVAAFTGTLEVDVLTTTGTNASLLYVLQAFPVEVSQSSLGATSQPPPQTIPAPVRKPLGRDW